MDRWEGFGIFPHTKNALQLNYKFYHCTIYLSAFDNQPQSILLPVLTSRFFQYSYPYDCAGYKP